MSEKDRQDLIDNHFLFKEGDRFLEASNLNRNWPEGRGIFHNNDKTFLVWVNEDDQLRIISMQEGADIGAVFGRLSRAVGHIQGVATSRTTTTSATSRPARPTSALPCAPPSTSACPSSQRTVESSKKLRRSTTCRSAESTASTLRAKSPSSTSPT